MFLPCLRGFPQQKIGLLLFPGIFLPKCRKGAAHRCGDCRPAAVFRNRWHGPSRLLRLLPW